MPAADGALEGEVDLMVLEYLAHAGYERAASALKVQIKERRAGKKSSWRPVGKAVVAVGLKRTVPFALLPTVLRFFSLGRVLTPCHLHCF